jgi:predicted metal-dependent hydrolase
MTSSNQPSLWDEPLADNELVIKKTNLDEVEIRRSKRRKNSVTAFREHGKTVVVVPAKLPAREIGDYVKDLVGKLDARDEKTASLEALEKRAAKLVNEYLDYDVIGNHHVPVTIKWVTNQNSRWGSCTPADGNIRLSHRLREMPAYVIECVLLHELIHLIVSDHGAKFYELMNRYPEYEKAEAYLDGYAMAERTNQN